MTERTAWIAGAAVCLLLAAAAAGSLGPALAQGVDTGYLYLAGATSVWNGEPLPFTQRGPLYSVLLALIGAATGAGGTPVQDSAREYGNIHRAGIADGFRATEYLRLVTWVQALLFACSGLFTAVALRMAGLPGAWCAVAAGIGLLSPAWFEISRVHDHVLDLFLLTAATAAAVRSWTRDFAPLPLVLAGVCLGLAGLSRPTFQLTTPLVTTVLAVLAWIAGRRLGLRRALLLVVPWLVLVGGWSLRNQYRHGFFGVTSSLGLALGAKVSPFLERARPAFPEEVDAFLPLRDERLVNSPEHVGNNWSDAGSQWLMRHRNMSYLEADRFLARVGLAAISRAPLRYLRTVATSVTDFYWPQLAGPRAFYLPCVGYEVLVVGAFLTSFLLWICFHLLGSWTFSRPVKLEDADVLVALAASIVFYTMAVSSVVDNAEPLHRMSVQFLLPAATAAVGWRLRAARLTRSAQFAGRGHL